MVDDYGTKITEGVMIKFYIGEQAYYSLVYNVEGKLCVKTKEGYILLDDVSYALEVIE